MTRHIPPAPEPIEDEELAEFFEGSRSAKYAPEEDYDDYEDEYVEYDEYDQYDDRYDDRRTEYVENDDFEQYDDYEVKYVEKPAKKRRPVAKNPTQRPTTDGFFRVAKKPDISPAKSVKTPRVALDDAPLAPKNPSVRKPGKIMDFVPFRHVGANEAEEPVPEPKITVRATRATVVKRRAPEVVPEPTTLKLKPSPKPRLEPDFYDDFEDDPIDEDELASVLANFADDATVGDAIAASKKEDYTDKPAISNMPKFSARRENREDFRDNIDDIEGTLSEDFISEPEPLDLDKYRKKEVTTPFLTSVYVEKRPLSASVPEKRADLGDNKIPAPVDRPLSSSRKKPYEPAKTPVLDEKNTFKTNRGQGKPTFTMVTPEKKSNKLMLVFAIIGTVLVGIIVGGLVYLVIFPQEG